MRAAWGVTKVVDLASARGAARLMRILVADYHPMIRTALDALLRDTDYQIVGIAGTGEEALRESNGLKPDLILLDLQMRAQRDRGAARHPRR